MKNKILILFVFLMLFFSSTVLGMTKAVPLENINSDLYLTQQAHLVDTNVLGNAFFTVKNFEIADNVVIDGDLFVVADTITLKSNVTYSDAIAKDGENAIDKINSHATVNGNVYVVCKNFTLEPGVEISGDLYVVSSVVNINKSANVKGNIFAVAREFTLNGRVSKSVYVGSEIFNMNYFGSINYDLHLSSDNVTLSSVIHRNAYIDAESIKTASNFLLYGDLELNANVVNFSGEIDGNANISTKKLDFITTADDTDNVNCVIKGNLDYSTPKELNFKDSIIQGEITYSVYRENSTTLNKAHIIKDFILSLITFVLYVFVIVWLFKVFAKNYSDSMRKITVKDSFIELGIGLLSIICVFLATIILLLTKVGSTLGFVLIIAYALILFLSTPLFILDIANLLKTKLKFYLIVPLLALALFLVGKIPVLGGLVMFLFTMIGAGRIIRNLIIKK